MNDMERRKFEDAFREAFQGAEAEPSENVWTNLELDLEKEESSRMKRRLLFYQVLAAASISFAVLMAGVGYYAVATHSNSDAPAKIASAAEHTSGSSDKKPATAPVLAPVKDADGNNSQDPAFSKEYPSHHPMNADNTDTDDKTQQRNEETGQDNNPGGELLANNRVDPSSSADASAHTNTNTASSPAFKTPSPHTKGAVNRNANTFQEADISRNQTVADAHDASSATVGDKAGSAALRGNKPAENAAGQNVAALNNVSSGDRSGEQSNTALSVVTGSSGNNTVAQRQTGGSQRGTDKQTLTQRPADYSRTDNLAARVSMIPGDIGTADAASSNQIAAGNTSIASVSATDNAMAGGQSIAVTKQPLPALSPSRQITLTIAREPQADPVALMFARLEQRERELRGDDNSKKKEKKDKTSDQSEKLWTSAGFAAGSFTNVNSSVNAASSSSNNAAISSSYNKLASQQVNAAGTSYTVGVGMGTKLSDRWIVQGGLNYQAQIYNYTSDKAVGNSFQALAPASVSTLDKANYVADARSQTMLVATAPYTVNNDSRFVSVPVQAGYLLVNRRTGIQLNAGVSTDLFLQNTNGAAGNLGMTTERLGDNTTYRSVNFSGLIGTELSYKIAPRYRLALSPGMRYAFNSVFKSSTGVQAMPLTFDVGLRFRYIFH